MGRDNHNAAVGRGAVLYDKRDQKWRSCCSEGGRCLWHVTNIYRDVNTGYLLYEIWDGTHTVREYINGADLLAEKMFEPAGWTIATGTKPTYVLTRENGVDDHHDPMQRANR